MAGSLNRVMLIGNLGRDPEFRSFQNGGKVCNFAIATTETWKDKQSGDRKERTQWHNIAVHSEGLIGVIDRYVKKGSKVYVEGQLETRKWQDRDGNDRWSTEVVLRGFGSQMILLSGSGDGQQGSGQRGQDRGQDRGQQSRGYHGGSGGHSAPYDADVPF